MVGLPSQGTSTICTIIYKKIGYDSKHLQSLAIPKGAKLFTADTTSMYTNIDPSTGIKHLHDFITSHLQTLPDYLVDLIIKSMSFVMKNNIFSFNDTYWMQNEGTAMGTPTACSYATITYGQHENRILPQFQQKSFIL
jgi:hypothetical protein